MTSKLNAQGTSEDRAAQRESPVGSGGWQPRYTILAILLIVNIVSFMDRSVMSVAIPYIAQDFRLSPLSMGIVMSAFFASYSLSQIPGGILADRFGPRRVATIAMIWWSIFTAITGATTTVTQMLLTRFAFGIGEGVYPSCAFKTVATWFPEKNRPAATGLMLAFSSLGAALAPLLVVPVVLAWGWRPVFFILFLPGIAVAFLFWSFVRDQGANWEGGNRAVKPESTADTAPLARPAATDSRSRIFREVALAKLMLAMFSTSIAYWGFTTWLPTYLVKARAFSMTQMGIAASLPSFAGVAGCVLGGWAIERFFAKRKRGVLVAAQLAAALSLFITFTTTSVVTLLVAQTIAGFTLLFFISAFWSIPMGSVPKESMGVVSGFINFGSQLAAFVSPICVGFFVQTSGGFDAAFAFLIASLIVSSAIVATLPEKSEPRQAPVAA